MDLIEILGLTLGLMISAILAVSLGFWTRTRMLPSKNPGCDPMTPEDITAELKSGTSRATLVKMLQLRTSDEHPLVHIVRDMLDHSMSGTTLFMLHRDRWHTLLMRRVKPLYMVPKRESTIVLSALTLGTLLAFAFTGNSTSFQILGNTLLILSVIEIPIFYRAKAWQGIETLAFYKMFSLILASIERDEFPELAGSARTFAVPEEIPPKKRLWFLPRRST